MSDAVEKIDLVAENIEKVNNASSDTSSKSKHKRSRSDTRKSHNSKSSSSRKTKNVSKMVDTRNQKDNKDAGDRSNLGKQISPSRIIVKEEILSDDQNSSVSDSRPLLLTRSRIRRIERRKAYSSNSSAIDSDHRKAKSEPIIITLDSDSDDNASAIHNRPSRTARIKGEIIRKLSRATTSKITTYKASDYSSSSDCESTKRKKKSKSKSVKSSSSSAAKRKNYLVNSLACQSRLKLRKHRNSHIARVYRPLKKKKDIKKLRKRFEEHKKSKQSNKASSPKKPSQQTPERRSLRSTSIEISTDSFTKSEQIADAPKTDNETNLQSDVKITPESKKASEGKKHVKKELNNIPVEEKNKEIKENANEESIPESKSEPIAEEKVDSQSEMIVETSQEHSKKLESDSNMEISSDVKPAVNIKPSSDIDPSSNVEPASNIEPASNVEPASNIEPVSNVEPTSNIELTSNMEPASNIDIVSNAQPSLDNIPSSNINPPSTVDNVPVSEMESEVQNASMNRSSTETASSEEGTKEPPKKDVTSTAIIPKVKKMKKKILKLKPRDRNIRKRGRPRLSDMKPVKSIPILNDVIQHPFIQNTFCFNIAPKLPKCRECRILVNRTVKFQLQSYCRFMEYRKLCYSKTGVILNAGFSEPSEATSEHLNQWLPQLDDPPKDLDCTTSKALLEHIGDQFCDLIEQENEALTLHIGDDDIITWKRIVQGVREMCDVCYTTLFNIHWVCPTCGLAVCIDCYKGRKQGITIEYEDGQPKNRDHYNWLFCSLRQPHDLKKLVMAQIIPGNALWTMRDLLHKARSIWNIPSYCKCNPQAIASSNKYISTGICKQLMCFVTKTFSTERSTLYFNNDSNVQNGENSYDDLDIEVSGSALKWLEGNVAENLEGMKSADDFCNSYEDFASLRGNLLSGINDDISSENEREISSFSLDDIIACVTKSQNGENKENSGKSVIKHFSNRYPQPNSGRDPLPIRIYTKLESNLSFSNVPHSWFCNGRLLFLLQSDHPDNLALFQENWKRGQPILVKGVDESLSKELWHPDAFCRDFGEVRNDLVNCRTGAIIKSLPMKRFWEGFESFSKRLKDDDGEYMLLKLKDWPPGEDFSEMLPQRFRDLMKGLPLPEYTHRDGILNLAGRLPSWFVRPDLGPKMYNAYGSALYPTKGTTNLHLDISDAVNVMVYVGIPQDGNAQLHIEEALKAIDEGGCDSLMRARVRARGAKPGALWHIYNARDADKIREMLTKVAMERGEKLEAHHDPIHDQSWYLDAELRKRLYRDYGVEGYAIAQCLGDAVFIPAGAPHQVRNLHSCIKVAEDFVSPENIAHCFKLTQEFRHLSDTHTNHEDKLQIKNIIYHVVRDALAHLLVDTDSVES